MSSAQHAIAVVVLLRKLRFVFARRLTTASNTRGKMAAEVAEFCAKLDKNYISEYVRQRNFLYGIFACVRVENYLMLVPDVLYSFAS